MNLISLSLPPLPNPSVSQASFYIIHLYSLIMFFFPLLLINVYRVEVNWFVQITGNGMYHVAAAISEVQR